MKIDVKVPVGTSGNWRVEEFEISEESAKFANMRASFHPGERFVFPGKYKRLMRGGSIIMSNTPAEIQDHATFIRKAMDSEIVLISGLGLGVALSKILESDKVKGVTVIEKSEDVISLVGPTFSCDERVNIVHADAFEWKPPRGKRYDVVWHDIWDYICSDNLSEMSKLHRKYGKRAGWQGSWCKELCQIYRSRWY